MNNKKSNIFEKIEQIRNHFHMSKKDFCNFLEISIPTYAKYTDGSRLISTEIILKISEKFKITTDFILNINCNNLEEAFLVYEYASNNNQSGEENILLAFLQREIILKKIKKIFKTAHAEKTIWEKLLFNPKEDTLRALGLIINQDFSLDNKISMKENLQTLIQNYYHKISIIGIVSKILAPSEKKYLYEFIDTLSESECALILDNASLVFQCIEETISAPYSHMILKLKK